MGRKKRNIRHVLFWIKSSKGTDGKAIFKIPNNWDKEDIKAALENWCSKFGAWTHGENVIHYGYKVIKVFNKNELKKKWKLVCERREKINEEYKILSAMFNVRKWQN